MPSVTDIQQQQASSNIHGKTTPPPPSSSQQQQQSLSTDQTSCDPITQAILILEKKQRNLGKRKEKLEINQKEANDGKELNKDQLDALAKYPEVLGQIECVKELAEQLKKIQLESAKTQKRLAKQAAEEKRLLVSERLREYAQIRYLLDHRPTTLKPEESTLLDQLSALIIAPDNSSNSISRSVDAVISIYQGGPSSTIKSLTGKTPQEIRETLEQLIKNVEVQAVSTTSSMPPPQEEQNKDSKTETTDTQLSVRNVNEYPLHFDGRNQNIASEQGTQNVTFFADSNNQPIQENNRDQSPDANQYVQTFTIVNSNINDQQSSSIQSQTQEESVNVVPPNDDTHQADEQWQHRGGSGTAQKTGQYPNGSGNKHFNRGGQNNYYSQWRGSRGSGGRYDNSQGNGQRQYNESNRARNGSYSHYRGNRGGNTRGGNRGYHNNSDGFQKSAQYQQNDQRQQIRSAPPSQQQ